MASDGVPAMVMINRATVQVLIRYVRRRTTAYQAIHNVIVSIFSSIYIGLDALFSGTKEGSVDIKRVFTVMLLSGTRENQSSHSMRRPHRRRVRTLSG
jgi:hypothetical protein